MPLHRWFEHFGLCGRLCTGGDWPRPLSLAEVDNNKDDRTDYNYERDRLTYGARIFLYRILAHNRLWWVSKIKAAKNRLGFCRGKNITTVRGLQHIEAFVGIHDAHRRRSPTDYLDVKLIC